MNEPDATGGEPLQAQHHESLETVLDRLRNADLNHDGVISIREILETFGTRSFGPVLMILGLIQFLPTGGIPLMPVVTGVLATLLFVQMLIKPQRPWLPARLLAINIPQQRLDGAIAKARPWIRRADRYLGPRLGVLLSRPALVLLALSGAATGVLIITLGLVPFAAAVPALALVCFGIGLTSKDGLALLGGYAIIAGSLGLGIYLFGLL